jgi:hypothetical protein
MNGKSGIIPAEILPAEEFEKINSFLKNKAGACTHQKFKDGVIFMKASCGFVNVTHDYDADEMGLKPNELVKFPDQTFGLCVGKIHSSSEFGYKKDQPRVCFVAEKTANVALFFPFPNNPENFQKEGFVKISKAG